MSVYLTFDGSAGRELGFTSLMLVRLSAFSACVEHLGSYSRISEPLGVDAFMLGEDLALMLTTSYCITVPSFEHAHA